jgi:hypothetical protein
MLPAHTFMLALFTAVSASSFVEVSFVNLLSDDDIFNNTLLFLINPSFRHIDIFTIVNQGFQAQQDQEA